jgi:predicted Zn-dependent peptidase
MVRGAQNEIIFNRDIPLQEVIEKVESVTAAEILDLAQHLFEKEKMVLTTLGPVQDKKAFENILYP